jgi:hypothetical protein
MNLVTDRLILKLTKLKIMGFIWMKHLPIVLIKNSGFRVNFFNNVTKTIILTKCIFYVGAGNIIDIILSKPSIL